VHDQVNRQRDRFARTAVRQSDIGHEDAMRESREGLLC
jgi:hypothetical protein